ncbi:MAG: AMP-binding protein, partial [Acidobacteriota bacterium]|nr:AMP-binding protein [Acidobacteriota bacterium]
PTETTVWSTLHKFTSDQETIVVGRPLANTQIYILDRHGQVCPVGVAGEIHIAGDGVARGYRGRADLTAEKFIPNPFSPDLNSRMYKTADLGKWHSDGTIEHLGRADHQVKLRGFRIELGEIEATLATLPEVREAVAMVREDTPGDKRLVAYIVADASHVANVSNAELDPSRLRARLRETLPDYMVPSAFVSLERLPLTPNGKVDRKKLPAPVIYSAGEVKGRAPESRMEVLLAEIWKDVLKVPSVNTDDDFFNLGGHSLLAAAMIAALNESLGYRVRLSSLFEASTLGALATAAEKQGRLEHQVSPIVPIKKTGTKPALFCVSRPNVNALGFIFLSRAVSKDLPVYGLQSNTETDGSISLFTLEEYEEKAREYIAAMREVQSDGPYFLTGFCEGGHIAFEMARQLEAMGLEVGILSVLDVWPIENTISRRRLKARNYGRVVLAFLKASNRDRLVMLERKLHGLPAIAPRPRVIAGKSIGTFGLNRDDRKLQSSYIASRHWPEKDFEPTIYNGKIIAFRVPKQPFYRIYDSYLGWRSRVRGTVEVIPTPGEHALILREPGVSVVAHELEARIDVYLARRAAATKLARSQSARGFSGDGAATADAF